MSATLATESWYQSAADRGRRRLFPRGIVGLFALVMVIVGWLALPAKHLHERLANAHETDLLTVAYLHAWLNAAPHDLRIQLTLARHQVLIGQNEQALASLSRLIDSGVGSIVISARRLRLNVLEAMLHKLKDDDPKRDRLLARIRTEIEVVANQVTNPIEIEAMLRRARALGHTDLVAKLLGRLVDMGRLAKAPDGTARIQLPSGAAASVASLAAEAIGLGDFRLAASLYWRAFDEASTHGARMDLLIQVARAEQAGNRLPQFFTALESRMDGLQLDTERYRILARLALAAGRLDLAELFAKRMLKFSNWFDGFGLSEAGSIVRQGLRWLFSAASTLSPIRSAHAQEVESVQEVRMDPRASRTRSRIRLAEPEGIAAPMIRAPRAKRRAAGLAVYGVTNAPALRKVTPAAAPVRLADGGGELAVPVNRGQPATAGKAAQPSRLVRRETKDEAGLDALIAHVMTERKVTASLPVRPDGVLPTPAGKGLPTRVRTNPGASRAALVLGDDIPTPQRPGDSTASTPDVASLSGNVQEVPGDEVMTGEDPDGPPSPVASVGAPQPPPRAAAVVHQSRARAPPADSLANPAPDSGRIHQPDAFLLSDTNTATGSFDNDNPLPQPAVSVADPLPGVAASAPGADQWESDPLDALIGHATARQLVRQTPTREQDRAAALFGEAFRTNAAQHWLQRFESDDDTPRRDSTDAVQATEDTSASAARDAPAAVSGPARTEPEPAGASAAALAEDDALSLLDQRVGTLDVPTTNPTLRRRYSTNAARGSRLPPERPQLAFDQELYLLAFQVFLARGSTENAYAVALAAVDQRPELTEWRIRLAETAQWSQRPLVALEQWQYLANRFNTREYWDRVNTLAGGVRDDRATLKYLHWQLSRHPEDTKSILKVARTYERMGDPRRAMRWLQQRIQRVRNERRLVLYAELADVAERLGDVPTVIQTLTTMAQLYGPDVRRAMRLASAHYAQGNPAAAFDALQFAAHLAADPAHHDKAAEKELRFWTDYAELARSLQRPDDAIRGYQQMLALDQFDAGNLQVMSSVIQEKSLSAAAEIMSLGYFRYLSTDFARDAVDLWLRDGRLDLAESFLDELAVEVRDSITGSVAFLKQRAAYYQTAGNMDQSITDLVSIFRIAPTDMQNRAALIWALLANRDSRRLNAVLSQWDRVARDEPTLWGPFGAALLAIGKPEDSLKYFVWQSRQRDDYLWWLAYADALDASGHQDAAWSLRRRAWTELRRNGAAEMAETAEKRNRIVGLAMRFAPADEARALIARLVSDSQALGPPGMTADSDDAQTAGLSVQNNLSMTADVAASAAAGAVLASVLEDSLQVTGGADVSEVANPDVIAPAQSRAMRSAANELAVSYMLSQQNVDGARAWLLSRYAKDLVQPAWAQLSIALARHDTTELDKLLSTMPEWLPTLDRVEALKRVGRIAEAQTESFDSLAARPDSDPAHQQLVDTMMNESQPSAGLSIVRAEQGVLDYSRNRLDAAVRLDQHTKGYVFGETGRTSSIDPAVVRNADSSTRHMGVGVNWTAENSSWMAEVGRREGLADNTTVRARWQKLISPMFDVTISGGINQPTADMAAMVVGGQKDELQAQATVNLTGRDFVTGLVSAGNLETQLGTRLGQVSRFSLEYGHRLRLDYPDVTLRAQLSATNYSKTNASDPIVTRLAPLGASNPAETFVPASSKQLDLYLNFGEAVSSRYSRKLRAFGSAGLSYNSESGGGFSLRGGLTTSIFGADRLTLFGSVTSKSPGNTRGSRELGLTYRMNY